MRLPADPLTCALHFVAENGRRLVAIEVKSGRGRDTLPGLEMFAKAFRPGRTLVVGVDGVSVEDFLSWPASHRIEG